MYIEYVHMLEYLVFLFKDDILMSDVTHFRAKINYQAYSF